MMVKQDLTRAKRVTHSGSSIEDGQDKWCSATGVVAVHDSAFVCVCRESGGAPN